MFPQPRHVETNGIRLAVYEQGDGPAVILLHGFPELAFSWRHQLPALAAAGFRAVAPDLRGYGLSDVPPNISDYHADVLLGDITGLLDALGLDTATIIGHDWGALLAWRMAQRHPARVGRLISLNIPHFPRGERDPIDVMRERLGDDFYIVNFQDSDEADRVFAEDTARFFDRMMRRSQVTRQQFDALPPSMKSLSLLKVVTRNDASGVPLLTDAERDYYAQAFDRTGFTGAINWYRNWSANWRSLEGVDDVIRVPALFIGAADDVVISPQQIEAMKPLVPDLEIHMIERCGHWSQQEHPDTVNRIVLDWLELRA